MSSSDSDRVVVVTGGTGALGRYVVRAFAGTGDRVHVPWRTRRRMEEVRGGLRDEMEEAGARVAFRACDVTDPEAVETFVGTVVEEEEGRLDVLVNGAGGFTAASLEETEPATWSSMLEVNATSAFLCSRAAAPVMREVGGGRILNIASRPALERGAAGMSAYAASKAALLNLTRSLADELRPHGITVNAVVPTIIDTPANRKAMPDADRSTWLDPAEIARVLRFLAGPEAGIVNGAAIPLERG